MSALPEARESLSYWESRLERLPRRAVRKRREARVMAARWRDRVIEAERAKYGAGILGAVFLLLAERRLPVGARHSSRQVVRVGTRIAVTLAVIATSLVILAIVAVIALFVALI